MAVINRGCNHFDGDPLKDSTEEEANLFAVALLFNEEDLALRFDSLDNYLLRGLLEHNIRYEFINIQMSIKKQTHPGNNSRLGLLLILP